MTAAALGHFLEHIWVGECSLDDDLGTASENKPNKTPLQPLMGADKHHERVHVPPAYLSGAFLNVLASITSDKAL